MLEISKIDLTNSKEKKLFVDFDYIIYKNDPFWVAPLRMEINQRLNTKKHPFYKTSEIQCFVAKKNSKIVGRIAAIDNQQYNEYHSSKIGFFGFFECIDDQEVANKLFDIVIEWHITRKNNVLNGPVNPSTNYESGLLVEGFEDSPKIMMTYNPKYYQKLFNNYGFNISMKLLAYSIDEDKLSNFEKFNKLNDLIQKRTKTKVRLLDKKNLKQEVEKIKTVYNQSWSNNWGFVPMSDDELKLMGDELSMIVNEKYAPFVEDENGNVVAFALALPDINRITKPFMGKLFPFNVLKLLFKKDKVKNLRVVLLGVLPEWRQKGLDALLYNVIINNGLKVGINHAEASWILDNNAEMKAGIEKMGGYKYKTYAIFEKNII